MNENFIVFNVFKYFRKLSQRKKIKITCNIERREHDGVLAYQLKLSAVVLFFVWIPHDYRHDKKKSQTRISDNNRCAKATTNHSKRKVENHVPQAAPQFVNCTTIPPQKKRKKNKNLRQPPMPLNSDLFGRWRLDGQQKKNIPAPVDETVLDWPPLPVPEPPDLAVTRAWLGFSFASSSPDRLPAFAARDRAVSPLPPNPNHGRTEPKPLLLSYSSAYQQRVAVSLARAQ